ncbi:MAG: 50S ribosomal protein L11 [Candidatus Thorarchaeota archaeon]|nr:50S ribosomal protein L11 [Candidatus Thorarchaeota archaeon]
MCCVRTECTASGVVNNLSEKPIIVEALVEGGKASGGPPIGPALGPTGVNIFQVVTKINEVTEPFTGLKVPVKIIVDPNNKSFEIEVGTPPTSALILKEVGVAKGSGEPTTKYIGNLSVDQLKNIARGKANDLSAQSMKTAVMIVSGSCGQMGVKIEGKTAKEFQKEVREGTWDAQLDEPLRE